MKRRTEVTIETERLMVIRHRPRPVVWCGQCASEVRMLSVDQAALLAKTRSILIYEMVEAGRLHFVESDEGLLLICPNSLKQNAELLSPPPQ